MARDTRFYKVVNGTAQPRLVEAASAAQALRHVTTPLYQVSVANERDIVTLMRDGVQVEVAGAEPSEPAADTMPLATR